MKKHEKLNAAYQTFIVLLALLSIILVILDLCGKISLASGALFWTDTCILIIFAVDYIVRFILAKGKWQFFKQNIFDLLAIIPFNSIFSFFRFARVFRAAKLTKLAKLSKLTKLARLTAVFGRFGTRAKNFLHTNGFIYVLYTSGVLILTSSFIMMYSWVYKSSNKNTEKAAMYAALAAVLTFIAPYIVNLFPTKAPDDVSTMGTSFVGESKPNGDIIKESTTPVDELTTDLDVFNESSTSVDESTLDTELSIDKIADVSIKIQSIEPIVAENDDAKIDVYNDSLTVENQVKTYPFTPSVNGRYRFEISGLTEGTDNKVNLVIKNSGGGVVNSTFYGITNGDGLTIDDMQADETFQVQVEQYKGFDSYTLNIGNQKEPLVVTGYTIVKDSVEFKEQRNIYWFTPPITGKYRFEISDLTKGSDHKVNLSVYNSRGGLEQSTYYGIENSNGLTIENMQAGQTYEVQVRQYSGYDSYSLNIGYQKDSVDISGYNVISDSIQYTDQKNVYFFTPTVTGRYRFEISNLTKGSDNKVNLYVLNSRGGEEGSTSYGIMNGDGLTIKDMQEGETYQIQVQQYKGYDMYNLNVGLQKETVDISKYSSVSDSIQYTDQRNVYAFTPSSSGKYRFEIQGLTDGSDNEVNVLVFNSRRGEEGSTIYGIVNGEGLEVADLQAGETYQVQVRYYSGFDSYKLITTKVSE